MAMTNTTTSALTVKIVVAPPHHKCVMGALLGEKICQVEMDPLAENHQVVVVTEDILLIKIPGMVEVADQVHHPLGGMRESLGEKNGRRREAEMEAEI